MSGNLYSWQIHETLSWLPTPSMIIMVASLIFCSTHVHHAAEWWVWQCLSWETFLPTTPCQRPPLSLARVTVSLGIFFLRPNIRVRFSYSSSCQQCGYSSIRLLVAALTRIFRRKKKLKIPVTWHCPGRRLPVPGRAAACRLPAVGMVPSVKMFQSSITVTEKQISRNEIPPVHRLLLLVVSSSWVSVKCIKNIISDSVFRFANVRIRNKNCLQMQTIPIFADASVRVYEDDPCLYTDNPYSQWAWSLSITHIDLHLTIYLWRKQCQSHSLDLTYITNTMHRRRSRSRPNFTTTQSRLNTAAEYKITAGTQKELNSAHTTLKLHSQVINLIVFLLLTLLLI